VEIRQILNDPHLHGPTYLTSIGSNLENSFIPRKIVQIFAGCAK